jgi:hypothetical protein
MEIRNMNRSFSVLLAALVVLLSACAAGTPAPSADRSPEEHLSARAAARWQHLIAGEWEQAYALLTPGYREVNDFDAYRQTMRERKIDWTAAHVTGVECESESRCTVRVRMEYSVIGGIPGVRDMSSVRTSAETWLKLGKDWYFLPRA